MQKRGLVAWCFYDWANSAFPTVIITFVFSAYFTQGLADDPVQGTDLWGRAMSLSALAVALAGPVLGAIADQTGRRKPWLGAFTVLAVLASGALWFAAPGAGLVVFALVMAALGNFAFEMGMVFYNAMLPSLAPKPLIGRLSGWGWGLGYLGGLACLGLVLVGLIQTETPWFGLDKAAAEHLRATGPLVAVWFALFALPLFLFTPDAPAGKVGAVTAARDGVATLIGTLRRVRDYRHIARFLIARMFYIDGLNTLFAFGGIYAAGTFGFSFEDLIIFGIAMNVSAGLGAGLFGWLDDRLGPKRTILISLVCFLGLGVAVLLAQTPGQFWAFALPVGLFVGPIQAASRSLMSHMAPEQLRGEMFGLFALSGKATAFMGPALFGMATVAFDSQRAGMASILVFLVIGFLLLRGVPDARGASPIEPAAREG